MFVTYYAIMLLLQTVVLIMRCVFFFLIFSFVCLFLSLFLRLSDYVCVGRHINLYVWVCALLLLLSHILLFVLYAFLNRLFNLKPSFLRFFDPEQITACFCAISINYVFRWSSFIVKVACKTKASLSVCYNHHLIHHLMMIMTFI